MMERRYSEGLTVDADGEQFRVVNVAADGQLPCLSWACTDGGFYPLGVGPELPPTERRAYRLALVDMLTPRWWWQWR